MKPPFSYYGGKQKIASKIIPHIPRHTVYAEPFCGGATIMFQKPCPGVTSAVQYREAINDKNKDVVNFFTVLRDDGEELCRRLQYSLYSQYMYADARNLPDTATPLERAEAFFINISQSFAKKLNSGWGTSTFGANDSASYMERVDRLQDYVKRMRGVYIANEDALRFIDRWDSPHTFFYVDPPYPGTSQGHYSGYSVDDFQALVDVLKNISGSFILSCYPMDNIEMPWPTIDFQARMTAANGKTRGEHNTTRTTRVERIWTHYSDVPVRPEMQALYDSGKFDCFAGGAGRQVDIFDKRIGGAR